MKISLDWGFLFKMYYSNVIDEVLYKNMENNLFLYFIPQEESWPRIYMVYLWNLPWHCVKECNIAGNIK